MKETPNATSVNKNINITQKRLKPELDYILKKFDESGYLIHKGTNSYVLANIIVDYADRISQERLKSSGDLSFWESSDIALISILAFERYRIYNTRSTPDLYSVVSNEKDIGTRVLHGVVISEELVAAGQYHNINIPKSQFKHPIPLGVRYEDLLSYTRLVSMKAQNKEEFIESFMTSDGVFIDMDYYIMPDIEGGANLYLGNLASDLEYLNFGYLTSSKKVPAGVRIKSSLKISPDYLRFVATELFAKFRVLNRMSSNQVHKFLSLKYNIEVMIKNNEITVPDFIPAEDILDFCEENVLLPKGYHEWKINHAVALKVDFLRDYDNSLHHAVVPFGEEGPRLRYELQNIMMDRGLQGLELSDKLLHDWELLTASFRNKIVEDGIFKGFYFVVPK